MQIIIKKTSELIPYINNPRKNDNAVDKVASSIKNFGFKVPIVIDKKGEIITGHTRLKAAKKLGIEEVPTIVADDLTEQQIKAFRIADNRVAEESEWDFELLEIEMEGLDEFSVEDLGFNVNELDFDVDNTSEVVEDDFDVEAELEKPAIAKRGDIWQLGRHRLMCGDSTTDDVDTLMDGKKADMVFTDPPYGMEYQSNMRTRTKKFEVLQNDNVALDFFKNIRENVDGFIYVCTTWKVAEKWMDLFKKYYELTNVVIWDKGRGGMGDLYKTFSTDYEMILVSHCGHEIKGRRHGSVWSFTKQETDKMKKDELLAMVNDMHKMKSVWDVAKDEATSYLHPTQKPIALAARAIRSSVDFERTVLDVFGGSGSTLIACEQTNRNCYMMELDEKYCDVIINRWEQFTGEKAILIGGETDGRG